jgi:crotonobetainyl-CoA:carnitine CoA-transferase CaiB-like acyl-CoA transferase
MTMPLEDVRILELTSVLGGPLAGRLLADLGADVIKIEQPGSGDASRNLGPYFLNGESAYFLAFNRNKRSLTLNLREEQGLQAFYSLVQKSDVVLDNFRPGVLERLHIDHDTLKTLNPSVISASLSGFGQDGPYRERPAFDGVVQALGGAMSVTGKTGDDPLYMGFPMGDVGGGWGLAFGVLAALHERARTGEGKRVDVSMLDMQVSFQAHLGAFYLASGNVPQPIGSGHPSNIPAKAFLAKDGLWVQIHCSTEPFWFKTAEMVASEVPGFEDLPSDTRFTTAVARLENRDSLERLLAEAVSTKTRAEWETLFVDWDVPGAPINNIAEVFEDPQVLHRKMLVEIDHPTAGKIKTSGNPIKIGPEERFTPPPLLGEHTGEILREVAGYSEESIDAMRSAGAI